MKISVHDIEDLLSRSPVEDVPCGSLRPGCAIGGWTVEAYLASGRTSEVYRVANVKTASTGALKLLADDTPAMRGRFLDEIAILERLDIDAVPKIYSKGSYGGRPYFVMEFLHPALLPLDKHAAFRLNISLARAVAALHSRGYVHRDIKPANILRRAGGEVVLADMGLAIPSGAAAGNRPGGLKDGGFAVGTPDFAAPEQLIKGVYGEREDVFSLGRVLRISFKKRVPRRVLPVLRKATENAPEDRYATAAGYADALEKAVASNKRAYVAAGLCAGALCAALAAFFCSGRRSADADDGSSVQRVEQAGTSANSADRVPGEDDAAYFDRMLVLARQGDADAQNAVGEAYFHGRGVQQDAREAFVWYSRAAEQGHLGAMTSVAWCKFHGRGCETDRAAAVALYLPAAEKEHLSAMADLAYCYIYGYGTEKDPARGFHWALRAAEKGHGEAQALAGECYLLGKGTAKNRELAIVWLERAAENGVRRASLRLDEIRSPERRE